MSAADQRTLKLFLQGKSINLFLVPYQFSKKSKYLSILINSDHLSRWKNYLFY